MNEQSDLDNQKQLAFKQAALEKTPDTLVALIKKEMADIVPKEKVEGYYLAWRVSEHIGVLLGVIQHDLAPMDGPGSFQRALGLYRPSQKYPEYEHQKWREA